MQQLYTPDTYSDNFCVDKIVLLSRYNTWNIFNILVGFALLCSQFTYYTFEQCSSLFMLKIMLMTTRLL